METGSWAGGVAAIAAAAIRAAAADAERTALARNATSAMWELACETGERAERLRGQKVERSTGDPHT
jgi:hypothetical protein